MKLISVVPNGKEEAVSVPAVSDTTSKGHKTSLEVKGNIIVTGKIEQFLAKCFCHRPLVDITSDQWQRERVISAMSASWWRFLSFLLGKSSEEQSVSRLLCAQDNRGKDVLCGV